ncbi:hypothetical protein GCM10011408_19560 [Dyella caseinilytica]|nr:hypothetical protein GCM10011408_19560 [Dyella caseinilytica]
MRERGLADAGYVFQQQVSTCDQAGKCQFDLTCLAKQYFVDLGNGGMDLPLQVFITKRGDG